MSTTEIQRQRLIVNVLRTARQSGLPCLIAADLDQPVRVYDRETDHPVVIRFRDLQADHVRCD